MRANKFYCDPDTRRTYEVVILPEDRQDPRVSERARLLRVHDIDRDIGAWYGVAPERLGDTELQAIIAAREALDDKDREIAGHMRDLQIERDEIAILLDISAPDNDGS